MCAHACDFHTHRVSPRMPCCVLCSCGENIELSKMDEHLANCHRAGADVLKSPINMMPFVSPAHELEPAYVEAT